MNNSTLIGRLVKDPELKFIPQSGMAVCNFTMAVNREISKEKKKEMEAKEQETADFIPIVVFGKMAENSANFLSKGSLCGVVGRITTGSYVDKNGEKKYTTKITADKVEFLDPKGSSNGRSSLPDSSHSSNFFGDDFGDDIFQPVDDEDIPF